MPCDRHPPSRRAASSLLAVAFVLIAGLVVGGLARSSPAAASRRGRAVHPEPSPDLAPAGEEALRVGRGESLLVVAPHPDDEVIAAGGLAQRVLERGGRVRVLLLTAGDGYVDAVRHETGTARPPAAEFIAYGERRLGEARAAARVLGRGVTVEVMGFPDGGLDILLRRHARSGPPMRSPTTGASDPPYDDEAMEPDLPYDGIDLRHAMARAIREARPTIVAIPDPADVHPDHRATASFALLALSDLEAEAGRGATRPRVLTYLVHWPAWPPGWDRSPRDGDAELPLSPPTDLPRRELLPRRLVLSGAEIATKRAALAEHASQVEVMPEFLGAFVRREEVFGEVHGVGGHGLELLLDGLHLPPAAAPRAPPPRLESAVAAPTNTTGR